MPRENVKVYAKWNVPLPFTPEAEKRPQVFLPAEAASVPQLQFGDDELFIFRGERQLGLDLLGKQARKLLGLFPDLQQFIVFQRLHLVGERGIIFKGLTGTHWSYPSVVWSERPAPTAGQRGPRP